MLAKYILAVLSVVFLTAALLRVRTQGLSHPQVRTWLLVAAIFTAISAWLSVQG